jgi:transposase
MINTTYGNYYIGLDLHKKINVYCIKKADGQILEEGTMPATRKDLRDWISGLESPFMLGMEATMFSGWVYDCVCSMIDEPNQVFVGHAAMLKAMAVMKNKSDKIDARMLSDLLRCNLFPSIYMAPQEMRDLRRVLRFRNYLVRLAISLKNKTAGLLMECGQSYQKKKLHQKRYFSDLLENLEETPESVVELLQFNRNMIETFEQSQKRLLRELAENKSLRQRVHVLMSIEGVGVVTALTWALEVGDPHRFSSIAKANSYCGLTSAQNSSAGKNKRGAISKKRNAHLQHVLIEAAKLAPIHNSQLREVRDKNDATGHRNRATLAVARKIVAYLMAVDRSGKIFVPRSA